MILHDFRCRECSLVTEQYVPSDLRVFPCPDCGNPADRVMLTPAKPHWAALAQGDSASPEAIRRFDRLHRQQKAKEEQSLNEHGDYGPRPGAD